MSKIEGRLKKLEDTVCVSREVFNIDIVGYGDGDLPPDIEYSHNGTQFHVRHVKHQQKTESLCQM